MVARLTVRQIQNLTAAQARRVDRMTADRPAPAAPPPVAADAPPPRAAMVRDMMALGMNRETAERRYDAQLAAWRKDRGDHP